MLATNCVTSSAVCFVWFLYILTIERKYILLGPRGRERELRVMVVPEETI